MANETAEHGVKTGSELSRWWDEMHDFMQVQYSFLPSRSVDGCLIGANTKLTPQLPLFSNFHLKNILISPSKVASSLLLRFTASAAFIWGL